MEDRIRLLGATQKGDVTELWLTQRLTRALMAHTAPFVPESVANETHAAKSQPLAAGNAVSGEDQDAVKGNATMLSFLVVSVDVTQGAGSCQLVFRNEVDQQRVSLAMNVTELGQWVSGLRRSFGKAGWQLPSSVGGDAQDIARRDLSVTLH